MVDGIQPQQVARRLGMEGIDARARKDDAGEHESARVGRPTVMALVRDVAHSLRALDRIEEDIEPQPEQQPETDGEHPEAREHAHHREHQ